MLLLFVVFTSFGQDSVVEFRTIFGNNKSFGGYGAPELKVGPVNGETGLFVGGRGGWIIGHKFVVGGAGYGLTTSNTFMEDPIHKPPPDEVAADSTRTISLEMGYGGLLLEYILFPKKAIHLSFPLIIGAGGTTLSAKKYQDDSNLNPNEWALYDFVENSGFFLLEPGVHVELNMAKFFRLSAGANYRYVSGVNLERLSSNDLSGLNFSLTLKFGEF
jgi:hypothetical protein